MHDKSDYPAGAVGSLASAIILGILIGVIMRVVISLVTVLMLAGCSYLSPHKIDIQQGNLITKEAFAAVKVGLTKAEVRAALGTPLLQDVFHANRWDYYFSHEQYGGFAKLKRVNEERRITFFFENDKLARIEGDTASLPSDAPPVKK
ncbi:MAG: outer membrane protein assembly factor BamE [Burkholderiales bacterium]|nr:outer membrane protein assembly factor BamE [Burkholderiales bacterium]